MVKRQSNCGVCKTEQDPLAGGSASGRGGPAADRGQRHLVESLCLNGNREIKRRAIGPAVEMQN